MKGKRSTNRSKDNQNKGRTNRPLTKRELCTGGKYHEFTLFYNLAYDNAAKIIHENIATSRKSTPDSSYLNFIRERQSEAEVRLMANFLFKKYAVRPNSNEPAITESDRTFVHYLVDKLLHIRNFYSHYYHDNSGIEFSKEAVNRIKKLHEWAKNQFMGSDEHAVQKYEANERAFPLFKSFGNQHFITQEGRAFLLSMFLTSGQMSKFLQQRKGSKANNRPEFKIKHDIYKYYTHKDGASRKYYTNEPSFIESLSEGDASLLLDRPALQIISYLNDVPTSFLDPTLIPIYSGADMIESEQELVDFLNGTPIFKEKATFELVTHELENTTTHEKYYKYDILLKVAGYPTHKFKLRLKVLHKLYLEELRRKKYEEASILTKFEQFIDERDGIYDFLEHPVAYLVALEESTSIRDELRNIRNYKLRNRSLQKQLSDRLESGKSDEKLLDFLSDRLSDEVDIEIYFNNLFSEGERKPRGRNEFMKFAVQYLMHKDIVPSWSFLQYKDSSKDVELSDINHVHSKEKIFHNKPVEGYRLGYTPENQILVTTTDADERYYFLIGHRCIANLLYYQLAKGKDIDGFLQPIIHDIKKLTAGSRELSLLDATTVPRRAMAVLDDTLAVPVAKAAMSRILHLKKHFNSILEGSVKMNRSEKNRQIMRCYKYFDWKYDSSSEFKFLRKNEYELLSVYHYVLKKRGKVLNIQKANYSNLLQGHSPDGPIDILKHMPEEIKAMLAKADSLDSLLLLVLEQSLMILNDYAGKINDTGTAKQTREDIFSKIGVSKTAKKELDTKSPFHVHPILPMKVYEDREVNNVSISRILKRNPSFTNGLAHNEDVTWLTEDWQGIADRKPLLRKLIGKVNEEYKQDILLWNIARQYLETGSTQVKNIVGTKQKHEWNISELAQSSIESQEITIEQEKYKVKLKFHQLDDNHILLSKKDLHNLIVCYRKRMESREMWNLTEVSGKCYIISIDELMKERDRLYHESLTWIKCLLRWEQNKLSPLTDEELARLAAKPDPELDHIKFEQVLAQTDIAADLRALIKKVRNDTFHANIPATTTWTELATNIELCTTLEYTEKEKRDYTI